MIAFSFSAERIAAVLAVLAAAGAPSRGLACRERRSAVDHQDRFREREFTRGLDRSFAPNLSIAAA